MRMTVTAQPTEWRVFEDHGGKTFVGFFDAGDSEVIIGLDKLPGSLRLVLERLYEVESGTDGQAPSLLRTQLVASLALEASNAER